MASSRPTSFVDVLRDHAATLGSQMLFGFSEDGKTDSATLSFAELEGHARRVAGALQAKGLEGKPVLLLYPPGLDYVAAFFGCLFAGAIAVPAYPPDPMRLQRSLPRLRAVIDDAGVEVALSTAGLVPMIAALAKQHSMPELTWVATDSIPADAADQWRPPVLEADGLAFLQYTSGSTADPKGVMVTHGNLLANSERIRDCFGSSADSRGMIWLPQYHDMGLIGGILQPVFVGFPTRLMSPIAMLQKPARWLQGVSSFGATISGGPNFAYELCLRKVDDATRQQLDLSTWRVAFNGADTVRASTMQAFADRFASTGFSARTFLPCYGLAEGTLIATGRPQGQGFASQTLDRAMLAQGRVRPAAEGSASVCVVGCGMAPADDRVRIAADDGRDLADGQVGEIRLAGPSVAAGYWRNPAKTAETFVHHDGQTELRTGDLGFILGGELYITGRAKDLIIVNGRNVYPQDIELVAERAHASVRPGCVAAFAADDAIVLVCELRKGAADDPAMVAAALRSAVAESVELGIDVIAFAGPGQVPKTSSGKVQRRACALAYREGQFSAVVVDARASKQGRPVESRTPLEQAVATIVADVLELDPSAVPNEEPLVAMGLDSVGAVELASRLQVELSLEVAWTELLGSASVQTLGAAVPAEPSVETPSPSPVSGRIPLSRGQQQLWLLQQMFPQQTAYNLVRALDVRGPLDRDALATAVAELGRRQTALTTLFVAEPEPYARPGAATLSLESRTVGSDAEIEACIVEQQTTPFDLAHDGPARVLLLERGPEQAVVVLAVHHIAIDGASFAIVARDLSALYEAAKHGRGASVPALSVSYADYAMASRAPSARGEEALAGWKRYLADLQAPEIATDRPRGPIQTFVGADIRRPLSAGLLAAIDDFAKAQRTTPFAVWLAALSATVRRCTGADDIAVGTAVGLRTRPELAHVVGFFVNTVCLRVSVDGTATFPQLARHAHGRALEALALAEVPFAEVVAATTPGADASKNPLFQVMLVMEDGAAAPLEIGELQTSPRPTSETTTRFDLRISIEREADASLVRLQYNTDLFDVGTAESLLQHLLRIVEEGTAAPQRSVAALLLSEAEHHRAWVEWNSTDRLHEDGQCLHHPLAAAVARDPDAIAVIAPERTLDYGTLAGMASAVAHNVCDHGAGRNELVAIVMDRGWEQIVAALGIVAAGAAYLPLDAGLPAARQEAVLRDGNVRIVVTQPHLVDTVVALGERCDTSLEVVVVDGTTSETPLDEIADPQPNDLGYVIYTSGSTGKPKGVMIDHRGALNTIVDINARFDVGPCDRVLALSSMGFDLSVYDVFGTLAAGGAIVLPAADRGGDPAHWVELIHAHGVTLWNSVPALAQMLVDYGTEVASIRHFLLSGDWIDLGLPAQLRARAPKATVTSLGGATEGSIWSIAREIGDIDPSWRSIPYGRPLANQRMLVLDRDLQACAPGVTGEIVIGGRGVALGYWNDAERTEQSFVTHPVTGERLYKTGDLGRYYPDGEIEILGRADFQVKVRGFRIELGEIETCLLSASGVQRAVAVARREASGDTRLVAFVVGDAVDQATLRSHVEQHLPNYMVPTTFVVLPDIPLTANGKVDRSALTAQLDATVCPTKVTASTPTEAMLVEIFAEVLGGVQVGTTDNLFAVGLTSLLLVRAHAQLRARVDEPPSLAELFQFPTVAELAQRLDRGTSTTEQARSAGHERAARRTAVPRRGSQRKRGTSA